MQLGWERRSRSLNWRGLWRSYVRTRLGIRQRWGRFGSRFQQFELSGSSAKSLCIGILQRHVHQIESKRRQAASCFELPASLIAAQQFFFFWSMRQKET